MALSRPRSAELCGTEYGTIQIEGRFCPRSHVLYNDATLPDRFNLHPFTASFLTALGIPEKTRVIHLSQFPLCTFAYAVTKASAALLISELATPTAGQYSGTLAFDVMVMHACRRKHLRCWTLNPELFHHMDGKSLIQNKEQSMAPVDVARREQVVRRNETSNIGCGFYSSDFYFGDDFEKLDLLKDKVGRKGRCLKPGRPG
jgi:hypothetical protein